MGTQTLHAHSNSTFLRKPSGLRLPTGLCYLSDRQTGSMAGYLPMRWQNPNIAGHSLLWTPRSHGKVRVAASASLNPAFPRTTWT